MRPRLDYSILTADLSKLAELAKQKYGPDAKAVYGPDGASFRVGEQVVERPAMPREIVRVYGLVAMGRGDAMQRFPYSFVPAEGNRQNREAVSHQRLQRFHSRAPQVFQYSDKDWRLEGCRTVATPSTGLSAIDSRLQLGSSDVCRIRWLKEPQATMLVGGRGRGGRRLGPRLDRAALPRAGQRLAQPVAGWRGAGRLRDVPRDLRPAPADWRSGRCDGGAHLSGEGRRSRRLSNSAARAPAGQTWYAFCLGFSWGFLGLRA